MVRTAPQKSVFLDGWMDGKVVLRSADPQIKKQNTSGLNLCISSCRVVPLQDVGDDVHLGHDERKSKTLSQRRRPHHTGTFAMVVEVAENC